MQELNKRQAQMDTAHEMLKRHHESTLALELRHLSEIHKLRDTQLSKQFHTELTNQREYTSREERSLKQRHMSQQRQQPKSLKVSWGLHYC